MTNTPTGASNGSITGAQALVRTLAAAGVKCLFTLSGNHVMPVFDACIDSGITLIHTRHEAATVHMADAWARLTGEIGVALVTGGPGHANAVSALYTALMGESPVLLLSGHAPLAQTGMGAFQEMRQAEIAAPLTKAASTVASAASLAAEVQAAIRTALGGRPGPVHLSLPMDVLEARCDAAPLASLCVADFAPVGQPMPASTANAILQRLRAARRPLILCGPVSLQPRHHPLRAQLQTVSGIPVVGMEGPRGIKDPALGAFAQVLSQADCVLLLGKAMDFTLGFGQAPGFDASCEFLQLDADMLERSRAQRALGKRLLASDSLGDFASATQGLLAACAGQAAPPAEWRAQVQQALDWRPPAWRTAQASGPGALHPAQILAAVQSLLDSHPASVLVIEGGEFGQWAQGCLRAPYRLVNGVAGALGCALPFALAARLVQPEAPVVTVLGDGGFGFHSSEIDTGVRYGLPFIAVVGNDAQWNAEAEIQRRVYGTERQIGCTLLPTRYDAVARAFGGHGAWVDTLEALAPALQAAHAARLPACVNVMLQAQPAPVLRQPV